VEEPDVGDVAGLVQRHDLVRGREVAADHAVVHTDCFDSCTQCHTNSKHEVLIYTM
jgi:hypothetical protein